MRRLEGRFERALRAQQCTRGHPSQPTNATRHGLEGEHPEADAPDVIEAISNGHIDYCQRAIV